MVSDHSPCTPELKCTNNLEAWGGISSVQFGGYLQIYHIRLILAHIVNNAEVADSPATTGNWYAVIFLTILLFGSNLYAQELTYQNKSVKFRTRLSIISYLVIGLSLFWTNAVGRGLDLQTVSKYLSSGPAHLCGLQDRKGALKPGLDADLVFFDPETTFVVTSDIIRHKNKVSFSF